MTYNIIDIDLTHSRIDEVYNLTGDSIKVLNATSDCFIQFDDTTQDPINLLLVDEIKVKFKKFYISNVGVKEQPEQPIFYIFEDRAKKKKNQSIKIIVSENFNFYDKISITDYIPKTIPEPIPEPIPDPTPEPTPTQIINITNPEPNVQIELNLSNLNFSKFTDNGSNIRITDENHNPLPFYLDSFNKTAMTGKLFFKTPVNIINSAIIYPADLNAPSVSDGDATFEFFDDFKGGVIDILKWNIVDATGWSVGNSELRGSNTTGRLLSHSLFSSGIIQEVKARTISLAQHGQTIGGFWVSASDGFSLIQSSNDFIRNNAVWFFVGSNIVPDDNTNFIQQYTVSPTTVNLKVTRLDTNIVTYNVAHTNSVVNEPIMLGLRADSVSAVLNQSYETYWDWIRVRKVTAATAIIT